MLKALYVDLDGTLLGPGGSLFAAEDGSFSLSAVQVIEACSRAGVELVVVTGRRQATAFENARLLGSSSYVFELGCGVVLDGALEWLTDGYEPSESAGTIHAQIAASGAPGLLMGAFPGRLQEHLPWSAGREVSHLLRGDVPVEQANALLADAGLGWLRLVDNGVLTAHGVLLSPTVFDLSVDVEAVHAYHLMPAGASKARGVARHREFRGWSAEECIAVGDSREDMGMGAAVGEFWLVANGGERDAELLSDAGSRSGVRVCAESYGAGVYEALVSALGEAAPTGA